MPKDDNGKPYPLVEVTWEDASSSTTGTWEIKTVGYLLGKSDDGRIVIASKCLQHGNFRHHWIPKAYIRKVRRLDVPKRKRPPKKMPE